MKMLKVISASMLLLLSVTSNIAAAADSASNKELNPWTDCGIGAMIFSNTAWAAAISNVIWDLGTTAVSSAGLSKQTCSGSNAKVAMFIGTTYANLEEETVKGNGQHVHAMLNIMNCDPASHDSIISSIRPEFVASLRDASYAGKASLVKAEEYYNIVQAKVSGEFAQQCRA